MGRKTAKIIYANGTKIVIETTVGKDYRFQIPKSLRNKIKPETLLKIEISFGGEKTNE